MKLLERSSQNADKTPLPLFKRPAVALSAMAATLVIAIAATWAIAWNVQSPAQREASQKAPEAAPITVAITRGDLRDTRTVGASLRASSSHTVHLPVPDDRAVVSREGTPAGQQLIPGGALTWINDRPIIALSGDVPLWRDLRPGDRGSDVTALQKGLQRAGYTLRADGAFGPATTRALEALYRRHGVTAPKISMPPVNGDENGSSDKPATVASTSVASPNEIVFIPHLPAAIESTPHLGQVLDGDSSTVVVAQGNPALVASVDGATASALAIGMTAHTTIDDNDVALTIESISSTAQPGAESDQASTSTVVFIPTEDADRLNGASRDTPLPVTVDLATPLTDVLVVPERAIITAKSGTTSVLLAQGSTFHSTPVDVLGCATGNCAISGDDTIAEGKAVRVDVKP